jgi:kinesin family protein 5
MAHAPTIYTSCHPNMVLQRVRDLLNPDTNNLAIRQDAVRGIFVENAVEEYVASTEELLQLVRIGDSNRAVGTTGMNDISSRSHSVVMITLETRDTVTRSMKLSKLSLVDLAGSESVSRTGAEGITLDEARMINKSLFNLAKCINALAGVGESEAALAASLLGSPAGDGSSVAPAAKRVSHIPYRDSKLTRLLQDSLGGNARTALIVCCSPCTSNMTESLSTLRFGQRAKQMKNKPVVNRVRSVEELERLLAKVRLHVGPLCTNAVLNRNLRSFAGRNCYRCSVCLHQGIAVANR